MHITLILLSFAPMSTNATDKSNVRHFEVYRSKVQSVKRVELRAKRWNQTRFCTYERARQANDTFRPSTLTFAPLEHARTCRYVFNFIAQLATLRDSLIRKILD